jgi:hypothetical protein
MAPGEARGAGIAFGEKDARVAQGGFLALEALRDPRRCRRPKRRSPASRFSS